MLSDKLRCGTLKFIVIPPLICQYVLGHGATSCSQHELILDFASFPTSQLHATNGTFAGTVEVAQDEVAKWSAKVVTTTSPEQQDAGDDDLLSIPLGQHHPTPPPVRKNFTALDDLILLRAVNMMKPWEAPKGTLNGIMKSFEKIACTCQKMNGFVQDKPGTALRTRFDKLVRQHRDAEVVAKRASGNVEEYNKRYRLLQDIITRMDDWNQRREDEKSLERAKSDGIEASGALMRRLAMGELEQELLGEDELEDNSKDTEESSSGTETSVLRVAGFWYCVPVTGQPKPVQSEPTLITPPRITPLLIMPPVGTRL
ncbi:unnamed protein product [Phytophthora lilii]|uniref:Unnamed protein product n=1 Tax=Phytophthora lilii TaxID=2077276 RepID=A0A9W7CUR7_9STRA|nr:unnamed protein product [Phytophthora lilii]